MKTMLLCLCVLAVGCSGMKTNSNNSSHALVAGPWSGSTTSSQGQGDSLLFANLQNQVSGSFFCVVECDFNLREIYDVLLHRASPRVQQRSGVLDYGIGGRQSGQPDDQHHGQPVALHRQHRSNGQVGE